MSCWLPQATDQILKTLKFLVFKLSIKSACSLNVQWAESLQHAEKSVGEVCQCGYSVSLVKYEEAAAHTDPPFAAELCSAGPIRSSFCVFYCLLFLDCTSVSKVRQFFCWGNWEGGQQAARFMHRFPFPTSPVQDALNSFFVNRARWNGESLSGAACSACLAPSAAFPCFTDLYSSWWLTPYSAAVPSLITPVPCLLSTAPFAPMNSHQQWLPKPAWMLPLRWHQWYPLLA